MCIFAQSYNIDMKKKILPIALVCLLLFSACGKDKYCRCSVRHEQKVRIITVRNSADCADIRYVQFNASDAEIGIIDSVFCSDYIFDVDTLFYDE